MRPPRLLAIFAALCMVGLVQAGPPRSPLRFVPEQSEFVLQIHQPRQLVDKVITLELVKQLQKLEQVKETLDSTSVRRFYQLLAYFEKQLGADRLDLLDKLAGGGIVVAAKLGDKAPALLVIQGTDEATSRKFLDVARTIVEQELARQDAKAALTKSKYRDIESWAVGKDLYLALVDGAIVASNREETFKAALDLNADKNAKNMAHNADLAEASKLLPPDRLASFWLNMAPVRKNPDFEPLYKTPRDPFITVVFGAWANLLGRTPYLCGALSMDADGPLLTFRVPRGTDGMGADGPVISPPKGQPASLPLLMPKGVLFSNSAYWDLSRYWTDRVALFGEERAKDIEKLEQQSSTVLSAVSLSKMLEAVGPYQRFVAVHQAKAGYERQPKNPIPAFAFVVDLRKPDEFKKGIEAALRTGALFVTGQFGLKMVEEKRGDVEITAYRFDEKKELKEDPDGFRFNFSPCFAKVGKQYLFCSTLELGREMVDLLIAEEKGERKGSAMKSHTAFAAAGGKQFIQSFQDQQLAAIILGQALPLEKAQAEVQANSKLFDLIEGLTMEEKYSSKSFSFDIRLKLKK